LDYTERIDATIGAEKVYFGEITMMKVVLKPLLLALLVGFIWLAATTLTAAGPLKNEQELQKIIDKAMHSLGIAKTTWQGPSDFTLKALNGREVSLSDYRGKIVFLNFWATWCPPCRIEMPSMEKLYQGFKGKDFVILAVSVKESKKVVEKFVKDYKLNFPVLMDPEGRVGREYMVFSIPTTYLINRHGGIIGQALGPRDWAGEDSFKLFGALLKIR
jgi:peroxiredoxin